MEILFLDVETTTKAKGNPFHEDNKLCLVGIRKCGVNHTYDIEYSDSAYGSNLNHIKRAIEEADLLVGFNIKFDLHWIRRYINDIRFPPIWDCQLGAFIISNQRTPYPSLDKECTKLGLGSKLDTISVQYWDAGINTPDIPLPLLTEYLEQDLALTEKLYNNQQPILVDNKIFKLGCKQLIVLQEMEFNGMIFDENESKSLDIKTEEELVQIRTDLDNLVGVQGIEWSSTDHISGILYGGTIKIKARVSTERLLKDGTIKQGEKNGVVLKTLPSLVKPNKKSETLPSSKYSDEELEYENKKRLRENKQPILRSYSVDKNNLRTLPAKGKAKAVIDLLLRRADLEKLQRTYFRGIPKKIAENGWKQGTVHGQFNQCVAITGRLSCTNPNQQNFDKRIKRLFKSRYL